ncbi:MAG: hypothetical protein AAGE61_13470, partial [Pseudomonadota bacterium]
MSIYNVTGFADDISSDALKGKGLGFDPKAADAFVASLDGATVGQLDTLTTQPKLIASTSAQGGIDGAASLTITARYKGRVIYQSTQVTGGGAPSPFKGNLDLTSADVFSRFPTAVRDAVSAETGDSGAPANFGTSLRLYDQGWAVTTTVPGGDAGNPFDTVVLDVKEPILTYLAKSFGLSAGVLNGTEAPPAFITAQGGEIAFGVTLDELKELQALSQSAPAPGSKAANARDALATRIENKFLAGFNDTIQDQRTEAAQTGTGSTVTTDTLEQTTTGSTAPTTRTFEGKTIYQEPYSEAALNKALAYTREFNGTSNSNVALTYTVRDPGSTEWKLETAHDLTPTQASALIGQLRQDGVLSNEVSDDLIFKGNGIGGWIKQDGSPATYKDDLAIRQSNSDIQTGA